MPVSLKEDASPFLDRLVALSGGSSLGLTTAHMNGISGLEPYIIWSTGLVCAFAVVQFARFMWIAERRAKQEQQSSDPLS